MSPSRTTIVLALATFVATSPNDPHARSSRVARRLDELSRGDTRMFFLHVDALQRFGSGLGIVEVGGVDALTGSEVRLRAPLARHAIHRSLDHASTDFRFFTAVCVESLTSSSVVADLLADSALGIPEREAFAATAPPALSRERDVGGFFGFGEANDSY